MKVTKKTIKYQFLAKEYNEEHVATEMIKQILVKASPSTSCWWSKLKNRIGESKDIFEQKTREQELKLTGGYNPVEGPTAKTCTGILNLLTKSYLVKSPSDVVITVDHMGNFEWEVSTARLLQLEAHDRSQYWSEDNTFFDKKVCLKLQIKVLLKTSGFGYMLVDPYYHNNFDVSVPLGYVSKLYAKSEELNIFIFIDVPKEGETKSIVIKKGDVVAYLIPDDKSSLEHEHKSFLATMLDTGFSNKRNKR